MEVVELDGSRLVGENEKMIPQEFDLAAGKYHCWNVSVIETTDSKRWSILPRSA